MTEDEALSEAESIRHKLQLSLGEGVFLTGLGHRGLVPVDQLLLKLESMF